MAGRGLFARIRYFVYQEEHPEGGTVHFQGYVQFLGVMRMSAVKDVFGARVHCEPAKGTALENKVYCQKEDSRVEGGDSAEVGEMFIAQKDKLVFVLEAIRDGAALSEIQDDYPVTYVRNRERLEDYGLSLKGVRSWAMEVEILYGPTGTGKSYTAWTENPDAYNVPWPTGGRWWWPGYVGQPTVVMDEFRHQIKMDVMLKVLDRYDWWLESKGRNFHFVSHKIVITTNMDPRDWYPGLSPAKKTMLGRRIREYCTIFDCTGVFGQFVKVARTERFTFREHVDHEGDVDMPDTPLDFSVGAESRNAYACLM